MVEGIGARALAALYTFVIVGTPPVIYNRHPPSLPLLVRPLGGLVRLVPTLRVLFKNETTTAFPFLTIYNKNPPQLCPLFHFFLYLWILLMTVDRYIHTSQKAIEKAEFDIL